MNHYILSICIPTYNRIVYLKKIIREIVSQIIINSLAIEICISDNASFDGTDIFLRELSENNDFVHYKINKFNFGYDFNICNLINNANGEYIWFLSDDDEISPNAILKVIEYINSKKCSCYFLKPVFFYDELDITYSDPKIQVFDNKEDALNNITWLVSFISSFIIKNTRFENIDKYIGLGFIHTPIIIECISNGTTGIIEEGLIYARQGNSGGYNKYLYFGENFNKILRDCQKKFLYNKKTIDNVLRKWIQKVILSNIVIDKFDKSFRFQDGYILLKAYGTLYGIRISLILHIIAPSFLYKLKYKYMGEKK